MLTFRMALFTAFAANALVAGTARGQGPVNVVITLKGDVGQYAGMCGSHGGEDKLSGGLQLVSFDQEDGTALYQGMLERKTSVDACGTQPNPTEDQVKMCFAHLDGSARMNVTLEVYEDDRGAYVKSEPLPAPAVQLTKRINGCPEAGEWLGAYPKDGIMSGLQIDDVPSGYLQAGAVWNIGARVDGVLAGRSSRHCVVVPGLALGKSNGDSVNGAGLPVNGVLRHDGHDTLRGWAREIDRRAMLLA